LCCLSLDTRKRANRSGRTMAEYKAGARHLTTPFILRVQPSSSSLSFLPTLFFSLSCHTLPVGWITTNGDILEWNREPLRGSRPKNKIK
jgi:hypothetical protein